MQSPSTSRAQFIYLTCQRGAEPALKKEIAKRRPNFRFSYSRPGFLTYKLPALESLEKRLALGVDSARLVFARSLTHSLGVVDKRSALNDLGEFDFERAADRVWELVEQEFGDDSQAARARTFAGKAPLRISRVDVYERDRLEIGARGFEPGETELAREIFDVVIKRAPERFQKYFAPNVDRLDEPRELGAICLDVVVVERDEWRVGFHRASDAHSQYPGGLLPIALPSDAVSRAFLKFEEGLRWSNFPIGVGSQCVDIGASPGGGSQALLARGADVLGVDPAEMAPIVLAHPNFTHLRGKIKQIKRKSFRKSRWFIADMNVAPNYALDALEELATRDDVHARGMLFTLKLFDWKLADEIPEYISRIKSWGFDRVKARQLQFNRQEIMIAALKKRDRR